MTPEESQTKLPRSLIVDRLQNKTANVYLSHKGPGTSEKTVVLVIMAKLQNLKNQPH